MKAAANTASEVSTAIRIWPMNTENTVIIEVINTTEANGKPIKLAKMDANVCSCHVIGSQ